MDLILTMGGIPPEMGTQKRRIVCFDASIMQSLALQGLSVMVYDSEIEPALGRRAEELAFELSKSWHLLGDEDFTAYKNISLGQSHEWTLWWWSLCPKIKFVVALQSLIRREKPSTIQYEEGICEWKIEILQKLAAAHSPTIKITPFSQAAPKKNTQNKQNANTSFVRWMSEHLKISAFAFLSFIGPIRRRPARSRIRVLGGTYFSILNVWARWAKERPFELVLLDPPAQMLQKKGFAFSMPEIFKTPKERKADGEQLRQIQKRWVEAKGNKSYRSRYRMDGFDYFEVFESELDEVVANTLPKYAQEFEADQHSLASERIGLVALPFDVPPRESLLIQAAKNARIPTVTILHGFPFLPEFDDRDNLQTDYLFVWGKWMQERFEKMGKGKKMRIIQTGNPKFDSIDPHLLENPWTPPKGRSRILILSSPQLGSSVLSSDEEPSRYAQELLEALKDLGADITLKLHPSEKEKTYQELLGSLSESITITRSGDILAYVEKSDIVIGPQSTALLEAMLMGRPVLYFNKTGFRCDAPLFNNRDGLREYTDAKEVRRSIDRLLGNEPKAMEGHRPSREQMEYYCGPLDGKSSQRVLEAIGRILDERT